MVKLNKIPKNEGVKCEILAKCEFLLPGGSGRTRIAKRMIDSAEKKNLLKEGSTIIVPNSGNTGIGAAVVGALKGYNVIVCLPDKMSSEKEQIINALGATVIRTPYYISVDDPESSFGVAKRLNSEIPNSIVLDPYSDPANSLAHYEETAEELWNQCDGKLDYVVLGDGTGGAFTGIGKKLKEKNPNIKIIGVDPQGYFLAYPQQTKDFIKYRVEGIGFEFDPKNLDRDYVDTWIKTEDRESFRMAKKIIRDEGLMIGGSSGSVLCAALKIAKSLPEDKRIVVMFVDGIRNYITKFVNDDWMLEHEYMTQDEYNELQKTSDNAKPHGSEHLISELELAEVNPISNETTLKVAMEEFKKQGVQSLPVIDQAHKLVGVINNRLIANVVARIEQPFDRTINKIYSQDFKKLRTSDYIKYLEKAFSRYKSVVIIGDNEEYYICEPKALVDHFMKNNI